MPAVPGTLVLVAGPSGAGKDSLLRYAAEALRSDEHFLFPRRTITRPCDGESELHDTLSRAEFEETVRRSGFALHWEAHGFQYGVPASVMDALERGKTVVVNVSRAIISDAAERFPNCLVVNVTALPQIIAARLQERGREAADSIEARMMRRGSELPPAVPAVAIDNSADLQTAGERFVAALRNTAPSRAAAL
ncbi:phosphonate metabolism protein/1,5-bisphosphokinase (PRPP-forming) PhnN [soil metagenome]